MINLSSNEQENVMAYMHIVTDPRRSIESFEKVVAELGGEPECLIARFAGELDGALHVVSVWDSKEEAEVFFAERLGPAIAKQLAPEPTGTPSTVDVEVQNTYLR